MNNLRTTTTTAKATVRRRSPAQRASVSTASPRSERLRRIAWTRISYARSHPLRQLVLKGSAPCWQDSLRRQKHAAHAARTGQKMPFSCRAVTRTVEVQRIGQYFERVQDPSTHVGWTSAFGKDALPQASSPSCESLKEPDRICTRDNPRHCVLGAPTTPFADRCEHGHPRASGERRRYGKCAVVGSGGSLLGRGCGDEISRHDMIIRINEPVLEGFEADVGYLSMFNCR